MGYRFDLRAHRAAHLADEADNRIDGAFADNATVQIAAAHPSLRAERNEFRADRLHVASAQPVFFFRQHDDGAAFRRFISETRKLGCVRESFRAHAIDSDELCGHTVTERDRASLV